MGGNDLVSIRSPVYILQGPSSVPPVCSRIDSGIRIEVDEIGPLRLTDVDLGSGDRGPSERTAFGGLGEETSGMWYMPQRRRSGLWTRYRSNVPHRRGR